MKKRILLTGAGPTGITGKLIKQRLSDDYNLSTPSSIELDLTDYLQVKNFFDRNSFDYVIHCAYYRGAAIDTVEKNLRMFYNLVVFSDRVTKMLYLGSGAEYDKSRPIVNVTELDFGRRVPLDSYGFWKYVIANHSLSSANIYNLRIFGTINPYEPYNKNVISNLCAKAILSDCLELNQDCYFSFIDMDDVICFIRYALEHDLEFHDYNMTSGENYLLSQIAEIVNSVSRKYKPVRFIREGLNKEYTGRNNRLIEIYNHFTPIEQSILKVYNYMIGIIQTIDYDEIDLRWSNMLNSSVLRMGGGGSFYLNFELSRVA